MTKYIVIKEQEYEIELRYDLGGISYFSRKMIPRGYYLSITPIERIGEVGIKKTHILFEEKEDEIYELILEVKRKSAKKEQEARLLALPIIENHLKRLNNN